MHHEARVEFDEEPPTELQRREQKPSITLKIPKPDEVQSDCLLWDFYPVTPLQVTVGIQVPIKATSILEAKSNV